MRIYSANDDLLIENKSWTKQSITDIKLKFKNRQSPNSTHNTLTAIHPKHGPVGSIQYYSLPDRLDIQGISVPREHRGNGYAGHLMDELQKRNPGIPINHGERTEAGQDWWDSYSFGKDVQNGRTMASTNGKIVRVKRRIKDSSVEDKVTDNQDNPPTTEEEMNPQEDQNYMQSYGSELTYKPFLNIFGNFELNK